MKNKIFLTLTFATVFALNLSASVTADKRIRTDVKDAEAVASAQATNYKAQENDHLSESKVHDKIAAQERRKAEGDRYKAETEAKKQAILKKADADIAALDKKGDDYNAKTHDTSTASAPSTTGQVTNTLKNAGATVVNKTGSVVDYVSKSFKNGFNKVSTLGSSNPKARLIVVTAATTLAVAYVLVKTVDGIRHALGLHNNDEEVVQIVTAPVVVETHLEQTTPSLYNTRN